MFPTKFPVVCLLVCIFISLPIRGHAQQTGNGAVSGIVTASDRLPLPAASVVLSTADGAVRSTSAAADGAFSLDDLPSATYTLKITSPGFATYTQSSVPVAIGRTTHLSITLTIATAQQNVSVTASPLTFDTSQTSSVINIDRDRVEELPIPNATI